MVEKVDVKEVQHPISSLYIKEDKWKSICENSLSNYSNMITRLSRKEATSKFILIYYSMALIIYSLTSHFFPQYFNDVLGEYFGIILSVVILIYSIINSNARYSERIGKLEEAINELKTIKREINSEQIELIRKRYVNVVDQQELRTQEDFFFTVNQLCKQNDIIWWLPLRFINNEGLDPEHQKSKIKEYLSELERYKIYFKYIMRIVRDIALYLIPVIIFGCCVYAKIKNLNF